MLMSDRRYPVIAAIIIGCLIAFSVIWCVASCLCCGASLCGACIKCLTCCNCCGACGRGGGGGRSRHKDDYQQMPPTPYQGYQPPAAPMQYNNGPQFATFDTPSKRPIHGDSLPAMPTWNDGRTRKVEDLSHQEDDVEMGSMHPQQHRGGYDQVPNREPASPTYDTPYNHNHNYNSDLGAQRLAPAQSQAQHGFQSPPLSPAPTYTTQPLMGHQRAESGDRFVAGSIAPSPNEYNHSISPYAPSTVNSTQYEPSMNYQSYRRSVSPPAAVPASNFYGHHNAASSVSAARPPSLLQVGRKPVQGSAREI